MVKLYPPTITSSGSKLLVRFFSGFTHSESGWSANYTATVPPIYGGTDPTACNSDTLANTDDSSCILPDGCTDVSACNYDPSAICDDGSCLTDYGCTDASSCNYDASATCDDGSCYNNIIASIMQDGGDLMVVTTPVGLYAN